MQGRHGDGVDQATATVYLSEALEALGEHARQYGVPLIYEPLNRYETNMVNTVEAGVKLLSGLSTKNVVLLADLFHMNIEEGDIAGSLRAGGPHVGHIHFADSNRRPAGLGHMDFGPIVEAVNEMNYDGFFAAEAFPYPTPREAAKQTVEKFRELFH